MKINSILKYFPYFLILYHLVFAGLAYDYVNQHNGDAVRYWFVGKNLSNARWLDFFGPGTDFIQFICFPLVKYLHLPGWAGCFLFSAWSGFGFWRLWNLLKHISSGNKFLWGISMILLLLPNVHFWTSLIGKEAVLFVPMVFIVEELYKKRYFSVSIMVSFLVIAWIRPHLAFVFLLAFILAVFWKGEISKKAKGILAAFTLLTGVGLYFLLSQITHARDGLLSKIERLYFVHNLKLKETSGYVPLEEYFYPYKLFTFYFRPFPLERNGLYNQIIGVENLIWLIGFLLVSYGVVRWFRNIKWTVFLLFAVFFLLLYGTMYAYAYANFGMIVRTKALVFPFLLVFVINAFSLRAGLSSLRA